MKAVGARSAMVVALLAGVVLLIAQTDLVRADYWAQLDLWVPFLTAAFAMLCGTLLFSVWRLGERSEYYLRFGERHAWSGEVALFGSRERSLVVGHAGHVEVVDLPPAVQRIAYVVAFLGLGLVAIDNRAVALLREAPGKLTASSLDVCAEPKPIEPVANATQGCALVRRAYRLGYAKSLGSCGPKESEKRREEVCRKRQPDEPFLHYEWRILESRLDSVARDDGKPGMIEKLGDQIDHLGALANATLDSVAMRPRSSHHLFTNLPDPRPSLSGRIDAMVSRRCGARLAQAPHFPPMADGPSGPSLMLEHVVDQLVFNPIYKPVVAQCGELTIHWDAPLDTCERLAQHPREVLEEQGALDAVAEVLAWRARKAELASLHMRELGAPPPAKRIASLQCLMFADAETATSEHEVELDGSKLRVRQTRTLPLGPDRASQIRLYKRLADVLAEGFSYGHLTSNESVGAKPQVAALGQRESRFVLTKLDFLRDADLFIGNQWLTERTDLLEVYPYHLHVKNFVEIFRTQYKLHRGRL